MASRYSPGPPSTGQSIPAPVSSTFTVPYVANFVVYQKSLTLSPGSFTINDTQGTTLFTVGLKSPLALHTRRALRDASGNTVVVLKKKIMTMHDRWSAYRGEHATQSNLLFTMAKASVLQFKHAFDIFLPNNTSNIPDFTLRGDFFSFNYVISYRDDRIAEANRHMNVAAVVLGKDQYGVTVYPGVDHAFIASLIVIVDQVMQEDKGSGGAWDFGDFNGVESQEAKSLVIEKVLVHFNEKCGPSGTSI